MPPTPSPKLPNPLRICVVAHLYPSRPGDYKGIFVHEIAASLAARGHEVHVVTPRRPGAPGEEVMDGVAVHRFWYWGWREGTQLSKFRGYPLLLLASMLAVGTLKCLAVVLRRRIPLLHAYWVVPSGVMAVVAGRLLRRRVVATAAGTDLNVMAARRLTRPFVRFALGGLDRLLAAGSDMKRIAVAHGLPESRAVVVPWLLSEEPPAEADREPIQLPGRPGARLVYVGNLAPPKRVDTLLRAMTQVIAAEPEAHLTLVGGGMLQEELEALAVNLGVASHVHFWGPRPHEQIMAIMKAADTVLHCSDHEGLPVAISEAMLCGRPVVAAGVGGIPDLVKDGATGFLSTPDGAEGFARAILRLAGDAALRARMSQNAREFAEHTLSRDRVIEKIEGIYAEVLG